MYNLSVPSGFKVDIDQIVRIGRTVDIEPSDTGNVYKPLVLGKKMFIIEYGETLAFNGVNATQP